MEFGIVESKKDEIMIKIIDDFPIEDEESKEGKVITLKKNNAIKLAKTLLREVRVR